MNKPIPLDQDIVELFNNVFNIKASPAQTFGIHFLRVDTTKGVSGVDKFGLEQKLATVMANVEVLGVNLSSYKLDKAKDTLAGEVFAEAYNPEGAARLFGPEVNTLTRRIGFNKNNLSNIVMTWDDYMSQMITGRNIAGPAPDQTTKAPIVSIKKIARHMFPDLDIHATKIGDIKSFSTDIWNAIKQDPDNETLKYFKGAYEGILNSGRYTAARGFEDLTQSELLEAVAIASFRKAQDTNTVSGLKRLLQASGVGGLKEMGTPIISPDDPLGVGGIFEALKKGKKGGFVLEKGATGEVIDSFFERIRAFAGKEYEDILKPFAGKVFQSDVKYLRFLLDPEGRLFLGKGDLYQTYQPVPLQSLVRDASGLPGVSEEGLPHGLMTSGAKPMTSARAKIVMTKEGVPVIKSAAQVGLEAFDEALEVGGGLADSNVLAALQAGSSAARKATKDQVKHLTSRGAFSIASALPRSLSALDPVHEFTLNKKFLNLVGKIGRAEPSWEAYEELKTFLGRPFNTPGVSEAWWLEKPKAGTAPLLEKEMYLIPGTTTESGAAKGGHYKVEGLQEIVDKSHIENIRGSVIKGRLSPFGLVTGHRVELEAVQKAYAGAPGRLLGRSQDKAITRFMVPTLFVDLSESEKSALAAREIYGEPGGIVTDRGTKTFQGMMREARSAEASLSKEELFDMLDEISQKTDEQGKSAVEVLRKNLTGEGESGHIRSFFRPKEGIAITPEVRQILEDRGFRVAFGQARNAKGEKEYLSIVSASSSDWENKVSIGVGGISDPGSMSIVHGEMRMTAVVRAPKDLRPSLYGEHMVTSAENLPKDKAMALFQHRTNLAGFMKGGPKEFVERYQKIIENSGERYKHKDLISLVNIGGEDFIDMDVYKVRGQNTVFGEFMEISDQIFKDTGLEAAAKGDPEAVGRLLLEKIPDGAKVASGNKVLLLNAHRRFSETEETQNFQKAMRMRLDTARKFGIGIKAQLGIEASQHPLFRAFTQHWESDTGLKLSGSFKRTGIPAGGRIINMRVAPKNSSLALLKGVAATMQGSKAVKDSGIPVLTLTEYLEHFVSDPKYGVSSTSIYGKAGARAEDLQGSYMFSRDARRELAQRLNKPGLEHGFILDMGTEYPFRLKEVTEASKATGPGMTSRYAFIPGVTGKAGSILTGRVRSANPNLNIRLGSETLAGAVVRLGTALRSPSRGITLGSAEEAYVWLQSSYASMMKKHGAFNEVLTTASRFDAAGALRVLPRSDQTLEGAMRMTELTSKDFEVGLTQKTLLEMFKNESDKKRVLEEIRKAKLAGTEKNLAWFGGMQANPLHGASHMNVVKFKLIDTVRDSLVVEPKAFISGFLTWKKNRDNDKDAVMAMIRKGPGYELEIKGKSKFLSEEEIIKKQVEFSKEEYKLYKGDVTRAIKEGVTNLEEFDLWHQKLLTSDYSRFKSLWHMFGLAPALSFTAEYTPFALAESFASASTDEVLGKSLSKMLPISYFKDAPFTTDAVKRYRGAMTTNIAGRTLSASETYSVASLIETNLPQSLIQKGGKYQDAAMELLGTEASIRKAMEAAPATFGVEEAKKIAIDASYKFYKTLSGFTASGEYDPGQGKMRFIGKIFGEIIDRNPSAGVEEMLKAAAEITGTVLGVGSYAHLEQVRPEKLQGAQFAIIRQATKRQDEGNLENLLQIANSETVDPERIASVTVQMDQATGEVKIQSELAEINRLIKEQAEVAAKAEPAPAAGSWLKKNFKLIAGIGVGLIGLKAISSLMSDEKPNRSRLSSSRALAFGDAPLPPEPDVRQPDDQGPQAMPKARRRAFVMSDAPGSQASMRANYSSVNNNEIASLINTGPMRGDYGGISIRDSRSYRGNWEMSQVADRLDRSDFIHPYQTS